MHEILHIITAILLLTGIFGIWLSQQEHGLDWMEQPPSVYVELGLIALVASGTGFLLHELSHKVVAQLYGHWAEFRAYWWGLAIPLVVVALTRIIFAAPGAVMISGYVTRRQNGIISAAGPTMNILIALIAYPFTTQVGSSETFLGKMALYVAILNALLAVFNMIPLGQLDGRKVWRWSPAVYILLVAAAIGALVLVFLSPAAFGLTG